MNTHTTCPSKRNQSAALAVLFIAAALGIGFLVLPARAQTTTQTVQIGTGAQAVTVTVTSPALVVVSATTAQTVQYNAGVPAAQGIAPADSGGGRATSLAFPKARGANMFFQFVPTWVHNSSHAGSVDLYGLTLSGAAA